MYFDRVAQFKDRLKLTLNALKKLHPEIEVPVGHILKVYERVFRWEIRNRNAVHHKGRYDDADIAQIAMLELLQTGKNDLEGAVFTRRLCRKAARRWVRRIQTRTALLDQFMEQFSELLIGELRKVGLVKG